MTKVLVYTKNPSPRLNYVLQHLQGYFGNLNFELCLDIETYKQWSGLSIYHGNEKIKEDEWSIPVSEYFYWSLDKLLREGDTFLKTISFETDVPKKFDIFSAVFWQLSRIEEYFPHRVDEHGRFPASESLLFKNNVLHTPLVDSWIFQWKKQLEAHFEIPIHDMETRPFWSVGIDVDQFYKHQYKPFYKKLGGICKDLVNRDLANLSERLRIYTGKWKDPFDSYDRIKNLQISKESICFFILSGGESPFDYNHSLRQKSIRQKIHELESFAGIGLHPSYDSMSKDGFIERELKNLQTCCIAPIIKSRQHYLRLNLPTTYRRLIQTGIQVDYSMGFAEQTGFRASCCRPFYWYDLENEITTSLKLIPFAAMDRTYHSYLKYEPEQAIKDFTELWQTTQKYQGHFHFIWHNSSFDFKSEWKGWDGVFERIIGQMTDRL